METIRIIYIAIIIATVVGMLAYFYKYDKGNKNFKPLCFAISAIAAIPVAVLALG